MRFHDTRHAHASLMLRNGVHPKIVLERLGHSTIAVAIDLYSHVTPGLQSEDRTGQMVRPGPIAGSDVIMGPPGNGWPLNFCPCFRQFVTYWLNSAKRKSPWVSGPGAFSCLKWLAGAGGFEPPATGFGDQRSGQTELRSCDVRRPRKGAYHYGDGPFTRSAVREFVWCPWRESNPRRAT